jgi:1,6-anhydro-N-acetylmuramate kinase
MRLFLRDAHDVRTRAKDRSFALDFANCLQKALALLRIAPQAIKVLSEPARTCNRQQLQNSKTSSRKRVREFFGPMKVSIGEIERIAGRVAVLTVFQITRQD